jgi:hypothetical protein
MLPPIASAEPDTAVSAARTRTLSFFIFHTSSSS